MKIRRNIPRLLLDRVFTIPRSYHRQFLEGKIQSVFHILQSHICRYLQIFYRDFKTFSTNVVKFSRCFRLVCLSTDSLSNKLLLALTSAVILASDSHGTHDHILLSDVPGSLGNPELLIGFTRN
jgi:hypothetical protein